MHSESSQRNKGFIPHINKLCVGFTLIEVLIYAALTAMILSFSLLTVYELLNSGDRGRNLKELAENQKLLEQKIHWTLQGISAINSPAAGATTTSLSIDKIGYSQNPVIIDVDAETARLKRGSGSPIPVTDDFYVAVRDLSFHHLDLSGRSAIKVSGSLFNGFTSTTLPINLLIFTEL